MAANDYYDSFDRRRNDPLPPIPPSDSSPTKPLRSNSDASYRQHTVSPFSDNTYPSYPHPSQQTSQTSFGNQDSSYHGASGVKGKTGTDPFGDHNAIPLKSQQSLDQNQKKVGYAGDVEDRAGRPSRRRTKKKKGWFSGRVAWVVWILTTIQVGVFIGELINNGMLTGSPIMIRPYFNPMIGPSPWVLIHMGARYAPCMHNVHNVTDNTQPLQWMCPSATSDADATCNLSQACGFGGVPNQAPGTALSDRTNEPNQWYRFIIPIFLHGGLIHIGFNLLLQVTLGRDMEKEIGSLRFVIVYFCSGIFGFVLGGNYAAPLIASTGASGALFGILALTLVDLLYTWGERKKPLRDLLFIVIDVAIAFVLGLLPGLDNFSHIGGFLMGLVLGICIMHSPNALRKRTGVDDPPYSVVGRDGNKETTGLKTFVRQPVGFFKGRKPFWWVWWLFRAAALVCVLVGFILLLDNFYSKRNECSWCKYLTCLDINGWCEIGKPIFKPAGQN